ncbi:carboxypeptidase-like regulatory domain-containing protein [Flavobacterium salilacus subsp. salilacus]|uniref:carboxypeptidase-like regulatory domain-containing protein n=1 Tax=Flavobacterium TaxID=237 RepID=UPI0010752CB9|nr:MULTISPECIES: carboxypeptidase-like regulatory domain-containing protein [Flavobacterium]KAF2519788.1 carboxypeptidase-like regulatory domain-containing protein [Flavobacterium salilacus subsp. salilacus]MBE1614313.1 carboxypeptidase-like regulatory domain-containing protein [Flavobacterium sp. SaA2.13]
MKLVYFVLCILFCASGVHSQTLSGYVYDEEENLPLQGAFVYLDGTTLSASTDSLGYFKIITKQKFNTDLIVRYIGYSTFKVTNPYQYTAPVKILMRQNALELKEVVINGKGPFTRKQMLKAFRESFLGKTRAGKSCEIINEEDIELYYDSKTFTLHASSLKPLQIKNQYLKYNIMFDLDECTIQYRRKTLDEVYQKGMYFVGTTSFTDVSENTSVDKHRRKTYYGSTQHLMKTIASNDWKEQKFALYVNGAPASPHNYLKVTDTLGLKKVEMQFKSENIKPLNVRLSGISEEQMQKIQEESQKKRDNLRFDILYDDKDQSYFKYNTGTFYIDSNGQYFPISELQFGGYMGDLKAGDMLPADYR